MEKSFKTDEEDGPKPKPAEAKKVNHYKPLSAVSYVILLSNLRFRRKQNSSDWIADENDRENDVTLQKPCRLFDHKARHNPLPTAAKVGYAKHLCARLMLSGKQDGRWPPASILRLLHYFRFINCFAGNLGRIGYG